MLNDIRRPAGAYDFVLQGRLLALEDRRTGSHRQYPGHHSGPDSRTRFLRLIAFLQLFGLPRCRGKLAPATEGDPLNRTKRSAADSVRRIYVCGVTASKLSKSATVLKTE